GDISQQTIMKVLIRGRDNNLEQIDLTMCCGVKDSDKLLAIVGLMHKSPRDVERAGLRDFLEMACHEIATLITNVKLYEESQYEITERKRMAKALQESEQRYRQLFEGISDAVMVFSPQLKFLDCNEVTLQKLGYSREEFLCIGFTDIVHPEFRKAADKHLKELRDGTNIMMESIYQRKDGSAIPVEVNSHRIEYKGQPAVLAVVRDINERKQAEELFKTMANSSTAGVYIVQNRKFVLMNPQFQKLVGFTEDELLGTDPLSLVHPEDREATRDYAVQMLKGNRTSPYEFRVISKEGRTIWTLETATSIDYKGARATLGNFMDITERRQAEERERQLQQELNLSSRLASIGEMAAGIAHEINNPLTGVIGFSDLLMKKKDVPDSIKKHINIIYDAAQRVASITSRMLSYAHPSQPERDSTNINDLIETTLAMQAYDLESNNIAVTTQFDPDLPNTITDSGQLQQVFLNIILNAKTAMIEAHHRGSLLVKTEKIDNTIKISFKDDGPGIAKENLGKIFHPFFTTKQVGKGAGLGLSVCYGIVKQHNGEIYAESTFGKGATFIVELPIITTAEKLKQTEPNR
ncbi:MAG: PAS domain S-box protein, partial [Dehalococcoidales bacterium]|nr:PAS domain S-box protein [Dehalococcoidales bacterium]